MRRRLERMARRKYDVLVVGGGIFGCWTAWEAASRGLRVAVLEKGDFANATSANYFKVAHGGIRYMQHGDLPRVRASSRERSALIRTAPHQVLPLPMVMPTYRHGAQRKLLLRLGFPLYDLITADRNRGIGDPTRRIPSTRFLSASEMLERFPGLPSDGLTGGAVFHDGQVYSPPRLALCSLKSAVSAGGDAANYTEVRDLLREDDQVHGARVTDLLTGEEHTLRGRVVINATGPWTEEFLRQSLDLDLGGKSPVFSRDVALVTDCQVSSDLGLACTTESRDEDAYFDRGGRHLFFLPWRDRTLVGVWHGVYDGPKDHVQVTAEELRSYVEEANRAYPGLGLTVDDVTTVNTGLTLFGDSDQPEGGHSFGKRSVLIDHPSDHGIDRLISLVGVRATMARSGAESAVDRAERMLGASVTDSTTESTPVYGGDFQTFEGLVASVERHLPADAGRETARAVAHNHGSAFTELLSYGEEDSANLRPLGETHVLRAEVVHAVRREMAQRLSDVVFRRTDLGTAGHPGDEALEECADLMASEAGWDDHRRRQELREVRDFLDSLGASREFDSDSHAPPHSPVGAAPSDVDEG